ncbi:hypothetical protein [Pseudomonas sp.]|jgi:hypothetical protein|uniref:hypothetical protein n=1 Tax=Pseudomonas sp. TaxID=306 RepID=UPI002729B3EC|nr:hypothetical protein [Pseudomonas sp.]
MIEEAQFNRVTLDCMTALRRRLKQDQGVVIRLGEPDALQRLVEASQNSADDVIRKLGSQLADLIRPSAPPESEPAMGQGAIAARQYHARTSRHTLEPESVPVSSGTSVRIYRGQVIRG